MTGEHDSEGIRNTEAWIESKGARYAYAYYDGTAFPSAMGVSGIPHAVLVSPDGTVMWAGHPASIPAEAIERGLAGAITKPIFEWDDAVSKVADALRRKELGKALIEAKKLAEKGVADSDVALATVERMVEGAVKSVESALEEGNYLDAWTAAERWAKQLKGLDSADRLESVIETCKNDPEAKRVIAGQKKLRALLGKKLKKKREADSLMDKIRELAEEYDGTYVSVEASRAIEQVRSIYESLR